MPDVWLENRSLLIFILDTYYFIQMSDICFKIINLKW